MKRTTYYDSDGNEIQQEEFINKENEPSQFLSVCPVCNGRGVVQGGFYDLFGSSTTAPERCRLCDGKGYISI